MISAETKAKIEALKGKYPHTHSVVLPALDLVQRELGYLPPEALREVAGLMGLPAIEVASTASFYAMYHRQPVGRHVVQVCTNLSCSLMGAHHIVDVLRQKLGIEVGQTTPDGMFTLMEVECLGSCGTAPMMQVDDTYYENLTEERVEHILAELRLA